LRVQRERERERERKRERARERESERARERARNLGEDSALAEELRIDRERRSRHLPGWRVGVRYLWSSGFRVQGRLWGFRLWGLGFRGSGFRVQGSGFRVQGSGTPVGFEVSVWGSGFWGLGFSVLGLDTLVPTAVAGASHTQLHSLTCSLSIAHTHTQSHSLTRSLYRTHTHLGANGGGGRLVERHLFAVSGLGRPRPKQ